jgi:hypothetical protein
MSDGIFLTHNNGQLVRMEESAYATELLLQDLLSKYPDLLAGEQMDRSEPRRWLLIKQEMGVPDDEATGDRWSLDHLFLDQDGIPTMIEVKRSTDTRIRREVVGQMLDYAANAVVYWPVESLRARFESACEAAKVTPEDRAAAAFGAAVELEELWSKVKTNLQAGKVRMVFVADEIPKELRRIIEFLNEQMDPAEVVGVEIKQFAGEGLKTLVPRIIGVTEESRSRKGPRAEGRTWDATSFFKYMEEHCLPEDVATGRKLYHWFESKGYRIWWGKGASLPGFVPVLDLADQKHQICEVWGNGSYEVMFQWYAYKPQFAEEAKRVELLKKFNRIPGVNLPANSITRRPSIPLSAFREAANFELLIEILEWMEAEIRAGVR